MCERMVCVCESFVSFYRFRIEKPEPFHSESEMIRGNFATHCEADG